MDSTEVSSSTKYNYNAHKSQLALIEVLVFLSFILSLILYPLGIVRRSRNSGFLKGFALVINAAIIALIPYVFSLMHNFDLKPGLFPIWGVFLLNAYYNVPNILKFHDPMSVGMTFVKIYLHVYYFISLLPTPKFHNLHEVFQYYTAARVGMYLIYIGSVIKACEAIAVMGSIVPTDIVDKLSLMASRNKGDGDIHVQEEPSRPGDANDPWLRCNYVVNHGRFRSSPRITIQEIWSCEDPSFSSSSGDLKNHCLSLSLLWKLCSKFRGRVPYRSSDKEEAWELVRDGLLLSSSSRCPFRVIEVELALFYDYLYNTSCFVRYHAGFLMSLTRHYVRITGVVVVAVATSLKPYHPKEGTPRILYHKHDVDVLLTWFVIIASAALGLVQLIVFLTSRWSKTMLIITYLTMKSRRRENQHQGCITKAIEQILRPRCGGGELSKPWQRQLGQYSLLDSCSYMQWSIALQLHLSLLAACTGNKFIRPGRKQSKSAPLTKEIERAVIQTLLDRGRQLTNGITTLQPSDQLPMETKKKLAWACTQLSTDVEVVLVWHIATSFCKINQNPLPLDAHGYCIDDVHVATSLSNYCAYLVAFAPDMLRGHVATTDYTCTTTIEEAYNLLKNCTKEHDIYQKLTGITTMEGVDVEFDDSIRQRDSASILQQGAVLGRLLVNQIGDSEIRWKVLAGFWAEMILYLAPNDRNEWEHLERLSDGGEFITHLWALLYHAGIDEQDVNYKARDIDTNPPELHQV